MSQPGAPLLVYGMTKSRIGLKNRDLKALRWCLDVLTKRYVHGPVREPDRRPHGRSGAALREPCRRARHLLLDAPSSRRLKASKAWRISFTFSCDIAYSDSSRVLSAAAWSQKYSW
jgi:hypothetical protein